MSRLLNSLDSFHILYCKIVSTKVIDNEDIVDAFLFRDEYKYLKLSIFDLDYLVIGDIFGKSKDNKLNTESHENIFLIKMIILQIVQLTSCYKI